MDTHKTEQAFDYTAPPQQNGEGRESFEKRQNHILAAATQVFAREGYQKASMRAVARESGVSLAGLYHYFDGKEKILFLIQFRAFTSLLSSLREKLYGVDDPVEQLRVMIRAHVGYFCNNMAALKVCSHELDSLSGAAYEETRGIRREYYELVRSILYKVVQEHKPDSTLDLHIATMTLFGALNWLYRWYHPDQDRSATVLARQIADQFLSGLIGSVSVVKTEV